ncbi:putative Molybdopterin-binding tetrapyrrole methyltransferase, one heme-binding site [uncultured Desulfobacterium sp.]|uniref:Putative Molybdopterin-binding tetrapyrrole methyltransferase, one heme-binding site n=1 Tax=uncultured Desulfobacterium sp. TaxID=201089 RepID=A0A445N1B3_9BACT|nr:putative Molybdopterin-binding tetrapyrrole methyltransferase, one heme-binding site [uncultured Desulfobacterium sp.]
MRHKFVLLISIVIWAFASGVLFAAPSQLGIVGLVKQPLNLSLEDLSGFEAINVQLNEVMQDGSFRGVFSYKGVPLKTLLELASIEKEESAFNKKVDLAILVRGENGKEIALSWGEVFYRNPGRIVIATSAQPIMPKHSCAGCHTTEEYQPRMDQLKRSISFPKLVVNSDTFADRCLDGVTSIEVVDLKPRMPSQKSEKIFSKEFSIIGPDIKPKTIKKLSGFPKTKMTVKHIGEGKGFHGIDNYQGTYLKSLLENVDVKPDLSQVFLASAPDGYRTLFSYGEIYLDPAGDRMLVADKINNEDIENGGKFVLVPPDDLMSDRDVKALEKIEIISLHRQPELYVIGIGCGDTNLITLEAISYMARADVFVAPEDITKRFQKYLGGKKVLLDIYEFAPPKVRKANPGLSEDQIQGILDQKHKEAAQKIRTELDNKRTVAILDYGDPTIWSGWSWARDYFKADRIEVIPGLSSFNVSNAMISERIGCNGNIVLATPRGIKENPDLIKAIAEKGETMAIFMGLKDLPELVSQFKIHYKTDTPACLVYKSGYSGSEDLVQTTLDGLEHAAAQHPEKFLGLIYVGPCLETKKDECCGKQPGAGSPRLP